MDNDSDNQTARRSGKGTSLWGAGTAILALGIIALAWYVYPRLRQDRVAIDALRKAQTASDQARSQVAPLTPSDRAAMEQRMRDQLTRMDRRLQTSFEARIAQVREQAHEASKDAFERAQALIQMEIHPIAVRLDRMESSKTTEDSRVAELQVQLDQMQQQMARQAGELQAVRLQISNRASTENREIADIKKGEERELKEVDSVENSIPTQRVDFEVFEHFTSEVAPGIFVHIDRADPAFDNVEGWMKVQPANRIFWLHRQNVAEPVVFYGTNDKKQCELVVTAVRGTSVKGFLLMPQQLPAQIASAGRTIH